MNNAIRSLIYSRIKALLAQSEGLTAVPHNLTKGELREQLLLEFFSDILPTRYTICSGFVTDCLGNISPQIDFIVAETFDIPRLVLQREVSLVPYEAIRAIVEIKSTIDIGELKKQLGQQMATFQNFHPIYWSAAPFDFRAYAYVIGLDASENALQQFMQENNFIRGCCVIGKYSLVRHEILDQANKFIRLQDDPETDNYEATATFIGCVFRDLETLTLYNSPYSGLIEKWRQMDDPDRQNDANLLNGKRWFWEAYVSETILEAARKYAR